MTSRERVGVGDDGLLASGVRSRPLPIRHDPGEPPAALAGSGLVPPVDDEGSGL
ncbi:MULTISPECIES: hypothetical protein [Candidatus Accumulibacter]|uniref:Uncharacterized protein n=1 Tax=Candidatus Accumulibacter cognatus TaxID=2954383 RepID=A0A7D5NC45_9PROT|nr:MULTISPECIES: hypothetical protein [Candidatus Accumulibacter]QLH51875.1 MAG: hypothetical protein HWD57_20310 [Candidatus Accumulibacter cognatus]